MSRDFDKAQEMVVASMEYVKVLGFRIRRTEVQRDDWKKVAQSHADEVIKLRQHVDALKAERDAAKQEAVSARQDAVTRAEADRKRIDGLMIQAQDMRAEIERLKKPRQHPVKVGEYVKNDNGDVCQVHEVYAEYLLNTGWTWAFENCTPCDPPTASHDTPAGKETAQAAAEPKPGDVVRLVRVPTNDEYPHDSGRWEPNWGGIGDYMRVHYVGSNINGTRVVRAVFGLEWPLSCVEVVKGGDK
jgi:hypothetical protein